MLPCPIDASPIPPVLPTDDNNRSLALDYLHTRDADADGIIRQTELYCNRRNPGPYHRVILALGFTSRNTTKPDWEPLYILPLLLPVQYKTTNNQEQNPGGIKEMHGWDNTKHDAVRRQHNSFPIPSHHILREEAGPSLSLTSLAL